MWTTTKFNASACEFKLVDGKRALLLLNQIIGYVEVDLPKEESGTKLILTTGQELVSKHKYDDLMKVILEGV